jgi:hypothetical protein
MKPSGVLLPLLALGMLSAEAAPCRPDNTNTTVTVKSKKFYCSESLDSLGCNIGKVVLKVDVQSSCRNSRSVDLRCDADLEISTHGVEKLPDSVSARERIELDRGRASKKIIIPWRELGRGALEVDVVAAECRVAERAPAVTEPEEGPQAVREQTPETAEPAAAAEPQAQPEKEVQPATPEPSGKAGELELLKEQNRARELEIRALELKIKLKEMEQKEK